MADGNEKVDISEALLSLSFPDSFFSLNLHEHRIFLRKWKFKCRWNSGVKHAVLAKVLIYKTIILSVFTYVFESWVLTKAT